MRITRQILYCILPGLLMSAGLKAQLKLIPVPPAAARYTEVEMENLRTTEQDTIDLPFWDDFSYYTGVPHPDRWMENSGVTVNRTHGINPPTIGLATFDGANATGNLYSTNPEAIGLGDSLVSKPIDLGKLLTTEVNNVYLSFFWQYFGNQEKPDAEDSLRLLFRNQQKEWIVIDVFTIDDIISEDIFTQVIYQVKPEFIHNGFQFKFEVFTRLSGPYDSWHIDYVYLNKNRQVNDKTYFDRAISTLPASVFNGYYAIPSAQFFTNPSKYLVSSSIDIYNLDKIFQPIEYSARIVNQFNSSEIVDVLNNNTEVNPILQGQQRRTLITNPPDSLAFDDDLDSLYLTLKFYISSGDSINPGGINYRINDTISRDFVIHNFYAYDDASAEFGLGLEQNKGKVAYMFTVDRPDYLTSVDISFVNIGREMPNTPFNMYVWRRLSDLGSDVLYVRENQVVESFSGFNHFQNIKLPEIFVLDTFYIGWEQISSEFLVVGFDKNTNTAGRIYYNIDGNWAQNGDLKGSLLIRPYFEQSDLPTGLPPGIEKKSLRIYPNPASTEIFIEGVYGEISVFHVSGKIALKISLNDEKTALDISGLQPGVYILTVSGISTRLVISR